MPPSNHRLTTAITARQSLWLIASAMVTAAPLMPKLPVWLLVIIALLFLWRALIWWQGERLPPRWLIFTIMVIVIGATGYFYRSLFGREPGVALLLAFLVLKSMELKGVRDGFTVILLCYFLQLALFFENQGPEIAAYALANVVLITATLINLNRDGQPPGRAIRLAAVMVAQSVPFMLILFLLFPRVQGPLWGMPRDAYAGMSGLSESMSPGTISSLTLSGAVAFRAKFNAEAPPQRDLYWRGPVLTRFDGRTWHAMRLPTFQKLQYDARGPAVDYFVILEPHDRPWLFALEMPGSLPADASITVDYQVLAKTPVRTRKRYEMRSYPLFVPGADEYAGRLGLARHVPAGSNPRSTALAATWRSQATDDAALIQTALSHFRRQPFVYTLSPPLLGDNGIDEFLFETRRGFCEHYAGAFVFLMRAAGLPARVVTGYQGGEVNPVDGYLLVRQSDAHAWAEVWLAGRGWVRVDPTAAVAPSRVERGIAAAVPEGDPLPFIVRSDLDWLRRLRFQWEALGNSWDQWVLGYTVERQREVLSRLGMKSPDWQSMTAAMAALTGLLMLALTGWALRRYSRSDPVQRAWSKLSRKLGRAGLSRRPAEGPLAYADRVKAARPHLADDVSAIARMYATLRYGRGGDAALQKKFLAHVKNLRVQ